jgi:hypothetical protein
MNEMVTRAVDWRSESAPYLHIFEQDTRKSLFLKDLARSLPKNNS